MPYHYGMTKQRALMSIAMLAAAVPVLPVPAVAQVARQNLSSGISIVDDGRQITVNVPQSLCRQDWNSFDGPVEDWVCPLMPSEENILIRQGLLATQRAPNKRSVQAILSSVQITYRMIDAHGNVVMQENGLGAVEQPETCGRPAGQSCELAVIFKPHREPLIG